MFCVNEGKGFSITFPNGIILSTQIGAGNYCESYHNNIIKQSRTPAGELTIKSSNCEIAIIEQKSREWLTGIAMKDLGESRIDDVVGWVELDRWLEYLDWCRNYKQVK